MPSKQVFSSSGRTDTAARNRLKPALMEALQFLKFNSHNNVLDFSEAAVPDAAEFESVLPEETTDEDVTKAIHQAQSSLE